MHEQFLKTPYLCELPSQSSLGSRCPPVLTKGEITVSPGVSPKEDRIVQFPIPSDCWFGSQILQINFKIKSPLVYPLQFYHISPFVKPFQNFLKGINKNMKIFQKMLPT